MTREELIRNLKYTMKKHENDTVSTFGTNISLMCKDVLDYLEQEPILDKIRAEIKALSPEPTAYDVVDGNPTKDAVWETLADVLKIIDKYKAESEGKDEIYHKTDSM